MIKTCRICHSTKLVFTGGLGDIAISDFTDKPSKGLKYPLNLVYCQECGLVQLDRNIPREKLYSKYWYKSSTNKVVRDDLKEIANLIKGAAVLDIGCNDGYMLSQVRGKTIRVGIDPSPNPYMQGYFEEREWIPFFDTITAIACLYDLPDPNKFISKVKQALTLKGIFIAEFEPLTVMIENNDLGFICHEHIEYYSYKSLVKLFEQNGLEIFKVEIVPINGGSYRIFARHYRKGSIDFKEKEYKASDIRAFFKRIEKNKQDFLDWSKNKNIVGYAASTKANTLVSYYGYYPDKVVDINLEKVGKFAFGQSKIIDYIPKGTEYLWVFPWGFLDYFKKKEKGYKGRWVTIIPEFKIWE